MWRRRLNLPHNAVKNDAHLEWLPLFMSRVT